MAEQIFWYAVRFKSVYSVEAYRQLHNNGYWKLNKKTIKNDIECDISTITSMRIFWARYILLHYDKTWKHIVYPEI